MNSAWKGSRHTSPDAPAGLEENESGRGKTRKYTKLPARRKFGKKALPSREGKSWRMEPRTMYSELYCQNSNHKRLSDCKKRSGRRLRCRTQGRSFEREIRRESPSPGEGFRVELVRNAGRGVGAGEEEVDHIGRPGRNAWSARGGGQWEVRHCVSGSSEFNNGKMA